MDIINTKKIINKRTVGKYNQKYEILNIKEHIKEGTAKQPDQNCAKINEYNLLIVTNDIPEFNCKKGDCFITHTLNQMIDIDSSIGSTNPLKNIEKKIFITVKNEVIYSELRTDYNEKEKVKHLKSYYWKTPDGWLYLYDKDRPEIYSFDIVSPLAITSDPVLQVSNEPIINNDVLLFTQTCFKKAEMPNLRIGIKEIYDKYEIWCKINNKNILKTKKKFKEELKKLAYKEEESKGVDINNKPGKRGYNINVILI